MVVPHHPSRPQRPRPQASQYWSLEEIPEFWRYILSRKNAAIPIVAPPPEPEKSSVPTFNDKKGTQVDSGSRDGRSSVHPQPSQAGSSETTKASQVGGPVDTRPVIGPDRPPLSSLNANAGNTRAFDKAPKSPASISRPKGSPSQPFNTPHSDIQAPATQSAVDENHPRHAHNQANSQRNTDRIITPSTGIGTEASTRQVAQHTSINSHPPSSHWAAHSVFNNNDSIRRDFAETRPHQPTSRPPRFRLNPAAVSFVQKPGWNPYTSSRDIAARTSNANHHSLRTTEQALRPPIRHPFAGPMSTDPRPVTNSNYYPGNMFNPIDYLSRAPFNGYQGNSFILPGGPSVTGPSRLPATIPPGHAPNPPRILPCHTRPTIPPRFYRQHVPHARQPIKHPIPHESPFDLDHFIPQFLRDYDVGLFDVAQVPSGQYISSSAALEAPVDAPGPLEHLPPAATTKTVYMVRVGESRDMQSEADIRQSVLDEWGSRRRFPIETMGHDPWLTPDGMLQCINLDRQTIRTVQQTAELLVSSPRRRALETTRLAFGSYHSHLPKGSRPTVVLGLLKDTRPEPSGLLDVPLNDLRKAIPMHYRGYNIDQAGIVTNDMVTSKRNGNEIPSSVEERAKQMRQWLWDRPEMVIVVVSHDDIMHHIVDFGERHTKWAHGQLREFTMFEGAERYGPSLVEIEDI